MHRLQCCGLCLCRIRRRSRRLQRTHTRRKVRLLFFRFGWHASLCRLVGPSFNVLYVVLCGKGDESFLAFCGIAVRLFLILRPLLLLLSLQRAQHRLHLVLFVVVLCVLSHVCVALGCSCSLRRIYLKSRRVVRWRLFLVVFRSFASTSSRRLCV